MITHLADHYALCALQRFINSIPPDELLTQLQTHHLSGLCYKLHTQKILGGFPDETSFVNALKTDYLTHQARNLDLWQHAEQYLKSLEAKGIAFLALKGLAMLAVLYDDPALRPMHDIDLLIHPEHTAEAISLGRQLGFEETHEPNSNYLLMKFVDSRPYALELHLMICQPLRYPIDRRAIWQASEHVQWNRRSLPVLCPRHAFLHAVINMVHDRFDAPFLKFLELHWIFCRLEVEAKQELYEDAKRYECLTPVRLVLESLYEWFDYDLAPESSPLGLPGFDCKHYPPYKAGLHPWQDLLFSTRLIDRPLRKIRFAWDYLLRKAQVRSPKVIPTDDYHL